MKKPINLVSKNIFTGEMLVEWLDDEIGTLIALSDNPIFFKFRLEKCVMDALRDDCGFCHHFINSFTKQDVDELAKCIDLFPNKARSFLISFFNRSDMAQVPFDSKPSFEQIEQLIKGDRKAVSIWRLVDIQMTGDTPYEFCGLAIIQSIVIHDSFYAFPIDIPRSEIQFLPDGEVRKIGERVGTVWCEADFVD